MGLSDGRCDICGSKLTSYLQDEKGRCYCSESCYEKSLPKCTICNRPMRQWTEAQDGKKYCSEECYKESWHKCSICNKPMKEWTETEDGKRYCSEECYRKTWHICTVCGKPMKEWTETEDGKKFCSEECYSKTWHKCSVCGKSMKEWVESEDGSKYCSEECFLEACPKCTVCGKHTDSWIENDKGEIFCSSECRTKTLPLCSICGKPMENWLVSQDGRLYCSEECYSHTLPRCLHCGKVMKEWLVLEDGRVYCSDNCASESSIMDRADMFRSMTGLTTDELEGLLVRNNWSLDEAIKNVDDYIQSLNGGVTASKVIVDGINNAGIYDKLAKNLANYNTMRGGKAGFKGYVFEDLHAAKATLGGIPTEVIGNNGPFDFKILNSDGTYSWGQAKVGYSSTNINWSDYKGQKIVIDKGNTQLIENARKAGMDVIESSVSEADAKNLAKAMQFEGKINGSKRAPIISNAYSYHQAGLNSAKTGAAFGAGFSIGANIVDLATGEKSIGEAGIAIAKDTATAAVGSYVVGAGTAVVANTAVGGAIISGATAAGTAIAGTTMGAATIAAEPQLQQQ